MGGQEAAGSIGFVPAPAKLQNIDLSEQIKRHSDYYARAIFR
jgi:hypothetical protein